MSLFLHHAETSRRCRGSRQKSRTYRHVTSNSHRPAGIWCQNDVVSTSMQRNHVASTLIRRQFRTKCPLGGWVRGAHGFERLSLRKCEYRAACRDVFRFLVLRIPTPCLRKETKQKNNDNFQQNTSFLGSNRSRKLKDFKYYTEKKIKSYFYLS